jgi:hypothetical protein
VNPLVSSRVFRAVSFLFLLLWAIFSWPELSTNTPTLVMLRTVLITLAVIVLATWISPIGRGVRCGLLWLPERSYVLVVALLGVGITVWTRRVPLNNLLVNGDAGMYVAQARAMAHGSLSLPLPSPRLAHTAKFLIEGLDGRLHGVFVPGYPLFLAPFVRFDAFALAGVVTSAMLTIAHYILARTVLRDAFAARLSILLLLPSWARAIETADLLSHAFVATLSALALVSALALKERASPRLAVALGLCAGWVLGARVLDGMVLAVVLAVVLAKPVFTRKLSPKFLAIALVCALPFVALIAVQQHVATGSWRRPTSVEYADRSDWPRNCLHLGFGREVGCLVEHPGERASFGDDGYSPDDGLRLIRERTGLHGAELFGAAWISVAAFVALVVAPSFELVLVALYAVLLAAAYGLFYYGNGVLHGARHMFPAAPFTAILVAHAIASLARLRLPSNRWNHAVTEGAVTLAWLVMAVLLHLPRWKSGAAETFRYQIARHDVRRLLERHRITRGIVIYPDVHSYLAAIDPWRDGNELIIVHSDRSGELDLRRKHPELPVWLVTADGNVLPVRSPAPPDGLLLEFERAWPSLQHPHGMGASILHANECCGVRASGERALLLFEADPGDSVDISFDMIRSGTYWLHLAAITAPDAGKYEFLVDGVSFAQWDGYAPGRIIVDVPSQTPVTLSAGPHVFTARCLGRSAHSHGSIGALDALVAVPTR